MVVTPGGRVTGGLVTGGFVTGGLVTGGCVVTGGVVVTGGGMRTVKVLDAELAWHEVGWTVTRWLPAEASAGTVAEPEPVPLLLPEPLPTTVLPSQRTRTLGNSHVREK
ncbi:hypothetical protein FXN61_34605 [Lentzea sp. PSKA42]|uniref:Uncharacterized protein n=1 Tax=Lentzea indica TaxID=2604800 RepID=A0ABX1FRH5_9PSEU|nr:hypothetical protein [Lentzea indica]NKE61615.1 hypothetical protein [Lentzea indica]